MFACFFLLVSYLALISINSEWLTRALNAFQWNSISSFIIIILYNSCVQYVRVVVALSNVTDYILVFILFCVSPIVSMCAVCLRIRITYTNMMTQKINKWICCCWCCCRLETTCTSYTILTDYWSWVLQLFVHALIFTCNFTLFLS